MNPIFDSSQLPIEGLSSFSSSSETQSLKELGLEGVFGQDIPIEEFEQFLNEHYTLIKTNLPESGNPKLKLVQLLSQAQVIILGENHYCREHRQWNGQVINQIWNHTDLVLVEDNSAKSPQLRDVKQEIAETAKRWDISVPSLMQTFQEKAILSVTGQAILDLSLNFYNPTEFLEAKKQIMKICELISKDVTQGEFDIKVRQFERDLEEASQKLDNYKLKNYITKSLITFWVDALNLNLSKFGKELKTANKERNHAFVNSVNSSRQELKAWNKTFVTTGSSHIKPNLNQTNQEEVEIIYQGLEEKVIDYVILDPLDPKDILESIYQENISQGAFNQPLAEPIKTAKKEEQLPDSRIIQVEKVKNFVNKFLAGKTFSTTEAATSNLILNNLLHKKLNEAELALKGSTPLKEKIKSAFFSFSS